MVWVKVDDGTPSSPITKFWPWIILDPCTSISFLSYHAFSCCIPLFWEMSCTSCTMIFGDTWGYLEQEQTMASPATPIPRCFSAHQCQKDAICLVRRCSPPLASISRSNCLEKVWERVQVPCIYIGNYRDLGITNHLLI